jgi:hypothetical protein
MEKVAPGVKKPEWARVGELSVNVRAARYSAEKKDVIAWRTGGD